jgi:hypothetical protein
VPSRKYPSWRQKTSTGRLVGWPRYPCGHTDNDSRHQLHFPRTLDSVPSLAEEISGRVYRWGCAASPITVLVERGGPCVLTLSRIFGYRMCSTCDIRILRLHLRLPRRLQMLYLRPGNSQKKVSIPESWKLVAAKRTDSSDVNPDVSSFCGSSGEPFTRDMQRSS